MVGREQDCVKFVYDLCTEGQIRNERGQCWSEAEFEAYCINHVWISFPQIPLLSYSSFSEFNMCYLTQQKCNTPEDYIGVDTTLGMCKCKTDELSQICDEECIAEQEDRLELHCPEPPLEPFIRITGRKSNGVKTIVVRNCPGS